MDLAATANIPAIQGAGSASWNLPFVHRRIAPNIKESCDERLFNGIMRAISSLIGLAMLLMGGIWILQGFNIAFLDSFMANDKQWALWGAILALLGTGQLYWSNARVR